MIKVRLKIPRPPDQLIRSGVTNFYLIVVIFGVRLENGNFPTLSVLSLTGDFVPLSANPWP